MDHWDKTRALSLYYAHQMRIVRAQFGLSSNAFDVLNLLANYPKVDTAKRLSEVSGLSKSYISTGLRELEKKDFIQKSFWHGNRKTVHLELTDNAEAVLDMTQKVQSLFDKKIFNGFSEDEISMFRNALEKMHKNISDE